MGRKKRSKCFKNSYKKYYQDPPNIKPITQKELDKNYKDLVTLANYVSSFNQPVYVRMFPQKAGG